MKTIQHLPLVLLLFAVADGVVLRGHSIVFRYGDDPAETESDDADPAPTESDQAAQEANEMDDADPAETDDAAPTDSSAGESAPAATSNASAPAGTANASASTESTADSDAQNGESTADSDAQDGESTTDSDVQDEAPSPPPADETNMQDTIANEAKTGFEKLDADGDGCATFAEFSDPYLAGFKASKGAGHVNTEQGKKDDDHAADEMRQALKENFDRMDAINKKDECITKDEFEGKVKTYVDSCDDQFHAIDTSGDERVSKNEAYAYANETNGNIDSAELDEIFKGYDADGSGFVSQTEFCGCDEPNKGGEGEDQTIKPPEDREKHEKEAAEKQKDLLFLTSIPQSMRLRLWKAIDSARMKGWKPKRCHVAI